MSQKNLLGFEKAFAISTAIQDLSSSLTPEYMKPIMGMQGNRLGFLTDKDKTGGYPEAVVKKCLIEAVLLGVQPYGNQFNIIAGNMYLTKEGCGHLLANYPGLKQTIVCGLPKINEAKTSAAIDVTINWSINNGSTNEKVIPIPLKVDSYTSVDSLVGKATRKARAWLISNLTGVEVSDGEITDAVIVGQTPATRSSLVVDNATKNLANKEELNNKKTPSEATKSGNKYGVVYSLNIQEVVVQLKELDLYKALEKHVDLKTTYKSMDEFLIEGTEEDLNNALNAI
jgi:hypothetical protein